MQILRLKLCNDHLKVLNMTFKFILNRLLRTSVLASLWRILSGEQLKIGDEKLEKLFFMMEVLMKDMGNPLAAISLDHPWLFKLFNSLGILKTIPYQHSLMNFMESVLTNHKSRQIDGNITQ